MDDDTGGTNIDGMSGRRCQRRASELCWARKWEETGAQPAREVDAMNGLARRCHQVGELHWWMRNPPPALHHQACAPPAGDWAVLKRTSFFWVRCRQRPQWSGFYEYNGAARGLRVLPRFVVSSSPAASDVVPT